MTPLDGEVHFMTELVKFIAQSLVDKPEDVSVTSRENSKNVIVELRVAPEDMGKVIGRQGRIAKAIRTVVKSATLREKKKYIVEIV
jgi:uncharacterized protein